MKIGILGGTFDPIHLGHLALAKNAQAQFSLDKVILIPAYDPPHKQDLPFLTPAADRYEMVKLAIRGEPFLEISDCEMNRKKISYTFDTLTELEKQYSGAAFYLILGKDAFESIDSWHQAEDIKKRVRFLVAQRQSSACVVPVGVNVEWIRMPLCPVSASGIRDAVRQGKNVAEYLHPEVGQYINTHGLYRKPRA